MGNSRRTKTNDPSRGPQEQSGRMSGTVKECLTGKAGEVRQNTGCGQPGAGMATLHPRGLHFGEKTAHVLHPWGSCKSGREFGRTTDIAGGSEYPDFRKPESVGSPQAAKASPLLAGAGQLGGGRLRGLGVNSRG